MSLRYLLHVLFKRQWLIIVALLAAPLIAGVVLVFTEPVYVSRVKLEVLDRSNANDPTASAKSTIKDDVFIQRQIELIFTDRLLSKVIDRAGLLPSPPSQSMYSRYMNAKPAVSKYTPERERIELIRALRNPAHVRADALNSVVLNITAQMNTPELAQKVSGALLEAYKEEFSRLQNVDSQFDEFYTKRKAALESAISDQQKEMEEFNKLHPRDLAVGKDPLLLPSPDQVKPGVLKSPNPGGEIPINPDTSQFSTTPTELGPLQLLMNEIAAREIELINVEAHNSKDSYAYKSVAEKIERAKQKLESYKQKMSEQQVLAVKWSGMTWKMESLRQQHQKITDDLLKVKTKTITEGPIGAIKVQDDPTYDPQPIYPKKVLYLVASVFIGLILGLALAYIAHVLDSTYHLPEDFYADTGIPVLATIPFDKSLAA
ncbi:MAG: Wzz/FepE/Etk N-terminal domain-containing protein [Planctomycetota bacterium]